METRKEMGKRRVTVPAIFMFALSVMVLLLTWQAECHAVTVSLQWGASSGATGYKVYYQTDSSSAPFSGAAPVDVANQTSTAITGLDPAHAYYFAVTAYNATGESAYSNVVSIPELTSPVASITFPANNASVNGTVAVTAVATDNVGVTRVEFYVNGVLQGTDTATPYTYGWNTSSLAAGAYTMTAKAYDAAGNVGESTAVVVSVVNDTTAPTVSLTSPASNAKVAGTVSVSASSTDDVGVSKVEFYANGSLLSASNVVPYSCNWNTASVANGNYTLLAKAYDSAGNVGQSGAVTVTVGNVVPDTTAPVVGSFTMPMTSSSLTVPITALSASDAVAVTGYLVTESATLPSATASGWSASAPASFTFSGAGAKTAYAWAKDAAGNVSAGLSRSVTITLPDTTAPTVTITSPADNSVVKGNKIVFAAASDNVKVTKVEFYVNGVLTLTSGSSPFKYSWNTRTVANGTCSLMAKAYDAAGNMTQSSTVNVTVKN